VIVSRHHVLRAQVKERDDGWPLRRGDESAVALCHIVS